MNDFISFLKESIKTTNNPKRRTENFPLSSILYTFRSLTVEHVPKTENGYSRSHPHTTTTTLHISNKTSVCAFSSPNITHENRLATQRKFPACVGAQYTNSLSLSLFDQSQWLVEKKLPSKIFSLDNRASITSE
jgi:hypothetical protein